MENCEIIVPRKAERQALGASEGRSTRREKEEKKVIISVQSAVSEVRTKRAL